MKVSVYIWGKLYLSICMYHNRHISNPETFHRVWGIFRVRYISLMLIKVDELGEFFVFSFRSKTANNTVATYLALINDCLEIHRFFNSGHCVKRTVFLPQNRIRMRQTVSSHRPKRVKVEFYCQIGSFFFQPDICFRSDSSRDVHCNCQLV